MTHVTNHLLCPSCMQRGHAVKSRTLDKLLVPSTRATLESTAGWAFCDTPTCPVVYFSSSPAAPGAPTRVLDESDLTVPVGVKRSSAPRPLCYCFDHSVESLEVEPEPDRVLDQLKALMKSDGCRCVSTNPQGRFCLGTVRAAIETIQAEVRP